MGKKWKNFSKLEKKIFKEMEKRDWTMKTIFGKFYPDGIIAEFTFPGVQEGSFDYWYDNEMMYLDEMSEKERLDDQEYKKQRCAVICQYVKEGRPGNVEICLDEGIVKFGKFQYILSNSIIKIHECINDPNPDYCFIREGDRCNARILIGGYSKDTFLIVEGKEYNMPIGLDEFYMLGICKDTKQQKECGIIVGVSLEMMEVQCWLVDDFWFHRIKELLLVDWLQNKWAKAKDKEDKEKQQNFVNKNKVSEKVESKELVKTGTSKISPEQIK